MTREELKSHCEKQIEMCELWAIGKGEKPSGKIYEEHNLILKLLEREQGLIPVNERLPEEDGEYLLFGKITDADENCFFVGKYDACAEKFGICEEQFDRHTLGCLGSEFYEYESVIAWMPLPEPYKVESEDKK